MSEVSKQEYMQMIQKAPKSDIHSHAGRGGHKKFIEDFYGVKIENPPSKFPSLNSMQEWYVKNIRWITKGKEGSLKRWEAAFRQADADNIAVLSLSFGVGEVDTMGGMEAFMQVLTTLSENYAPNTIFLPELTYLRGCNIDKAVDDLEEILSYNYFKSIDICGNELEDSIEKFIPMYRKAEAGGLKLKAHVGEFGTADDVMKAVELLHLSEVHHGVAAANSPEILRWLADNQIQLNVCPTSNVMLGVASSYEEHPIGRIFHAGVPVTINTDDLLIFNQSVTEEYVNLFTAGVLAMEELEEIRLGYIAREGLFSRVI